MLRRLLPLFALALALAALSACGDDGDAAPNGTPVTTPAPDATLELDNEPFQSVRLLPPDALSAENLENAGTATSDDGDIQVARARAADVEEWELVSAAEDGWLVWQPQIIHDVLDDAGPGATLVSVEQVQWPNACLGLQRPDEFCAEVITPGYRVVIEQDGEEIVYHTARARDFRRAGDVQDASS